MENVLNRGLNFCILPLKLDITQVLVDFNRFERTMIWHEFWFGREKENVYKYPIFKTRKTNLPKNYKIHKGLKTFLGAVKSEIMDPKNRNKVQCNIPQDELEALLDLIKLQKEGKIVIKPCDKGAGIIILTHSDYVKACMEHLNSKQTNNDGTSDSFYVKVHQSKLDQVKGKIINLIQEGYDNQILTKQEYEAMSDISENAGKFYCTFKVHKSHEVGKAPPVRPISSGSGSIYEQIGRYLEHHIKDVAKEYPSYLQDTLDFIRSIEQINEEEVFPDNTILVTMDVSSLFTVIPQKEGAECVRQKLNMRDDQQVPTEFLIRILKICNEFNIFQFNGELYHQRIGSGMGARPTPPYANIFMATKVDPEIQRIANEMGRDGSMSLKLLKRFLDDLFLIFQGSTQRLHQFFNKLNEIHPSIKLTMNHTNPENELDEMQCSCSPNTEIPFLDTSCSIQNRKIILDLYRKPTDRNQYLLTSSIHPAHCHENIPLSLAMRITRICTIPETRDKRHQELKEMLLDRDYRSGMIDAAIQKAKAVPRSQAIKFVAKQESNKRPTFVVSYDPRLPNIQNITQKHWRAMSRLDPYLAEVYNEPPLIAYKRTQNIRDKVIRAKLAKPSTRPTRFLPGMKKCGKQLCGSCPYIKEGNEVKYKNTKWKILKEMNCETENCVYLIECQKEKCKQRYIGETNRDIRSRIAEHRGYINNQHTKATGEHFNLPGHSVNDMRFTILEKVKYDDMAYRKEREKDIIRLFDVFYNGLNRQD